VSENHYSALHTVATLHPDAREPSRTVTATCAALATGLPALVSENVGAKAAVTEGRNGWVVPAEDVGALAERMQGCVEHPGEVADMRDAAVTAAQDYTWAAYRERVTTVLHTVIEAPEPVSA